MNCQPQTPDRTKAPAIRRSAKSAPAWLMVKAIRGYQLFISPWLGPTCRYHPTCSAYALEAVRVHGLRKGGWLALRRLLRCHPFGGFGHDPVPLPRDDQPGPKQAGEQTGHQTKQRRTADTNPYYLDDQDS